MAKQTLAIRAWIAAWLASICVGTMGPTVSAGIITDAIDVVLAAEAYDRTGEYVVEEPWPHILVGTLDETGWVLDNLRRGLGRWVGVGVGAVATRARGG